MDITRCVSNKCRREPKVLGRISRTTYDTYPNPRTNECLDSFGDFAFLHNPDWSSGNSQKPEIADDNPTTIFTSYVRTLFFRRISFGLVNALLTLQNMLDVLLAEYRWKICCTYLDDIIIFSKDVKHHMKYLENILIPPKKTGLSPKLQKCTYFKEDAECLGHVIQPGRAAHRPDKSCSSS